MKYFHEKYEFGTELHNNVIPSINTIIIFQIRKNLNF